MPLICPICLNRLDDADSSIECVALPCGHVFHQECALPWLEQRPVCAQCRRSISDVTTDLTKIFFASSDCTEKDELAYLKAQLEQLQADKNAAKEETKQANRSIAELKESKNDSESHAEAMLNDLVTHQQELMQAKARLRESRRDQKELVLRLAEAEQLADRYQRKLKQLKEAGQRGRDRRLNTLPPDFSMMMPSEPTELQTLPPAPLPVPRPRTFGSLSAQEDSSADSPEASSTAEMHTKPASNSPPVPRPRTYRSDSLKQQDAEPNVSTDASATEILLEVEGSASDITDSAQTVREKDDKTVGECSEMLESSEHQSILHLAFEATL